MMMRRFFSTIFFLITTLVIGTSVVHAQSLPSAPGAANVPTAGRFFDQRFDRIPGALPKSVVPSDIALHLELDPEKESFLGDAVYSVYVREPTREIVMHASGLSIASANLVENNLPAAFSLDAASAQIRFTLQNALPVGVHALRVKFAGKISTNSMGLYRARMPGPIGGAMLATQFQPIAARTMVPCFDEPAFKSKWTVSITAPTKYIAISNAEIVSKSEIENGARRKTVFASTPPMSSYLLALAVGEFDVLEENAHGIRFGIYTPPGQKAKAKQAMQWTQSIFGYQRVYIGAEYALTKLDQVVVPGKRGAMENWGLITYGADSLLVDPETADEATKYYAFSIIAHEIAHQWFGNLVTLAWWDDLWLNESFASWFASKSMRELRPAMQPQNRNVNTREHAMQVDALPSARAIERTVKSDTAAHAAFDAITYDKGELVLGNLEAYTGEDAWRRGVIAYMQKYSFRVARASDLWFEMDLASQREIGRFARSWTQQPNFPILNVKANCEAGKQTISFTQSPGVSKSGEPARWRLALPVQWLATVGVTQLVSTAPTLVRVERDSTTLDGGACERVPMIDPDGAGYFRVHYDESLFARVRERFSDFPVPAQQRLIADTIALSLDGKASLQSAFQLLAQLKSTSEPQTWITAVQRLEQLLQLTQGTPQHAPLKSRVLSLTAAPFEALGFSAKRQETDATRALRGALIVLRARAGDPAIQAWATSRFAQREKDPSVMQGDVGNAMLSSIGVLSRSDDVRILADMIADGRNVGYAWSLGNAIGAGSERGAAISALARVSDERLPPSTRQRILRNVARAGHSQLAFEYLEKNLSTLLASAAADDRADLFAHVLDSSADIALARRVFEAAKAALPADTLEPVETAALLVERRSDTLARLQAQWRDL